MQKQKQIKKSANTGFTLIEILVVIGLIALLAAIVIVAINPARQFAQGRDTQRTSNLNSILNAVGQRMTDNKGIFAGTFVISGTTYTCGPLPSTATDITSTMASDTTTATGNLGCLAPTYIQALPTDPSGVTAPAIGYQIFQEASTGRVHVIATATEPSVPRTTQLEIIR
jgi:type IV pilus assembly protein PilA